MHEPHPPEPTITPADRDPLGSLVYEAQSAYAHVRAPLKHTIEYLHAYTATEQAHPMVKPWNLASVLADALAHLKRLNKRFNQLESAINHRRIVPRARGI